MTVWQLYYRTPYPEVLRFAQDGIRYSKRVEWEREHQEKGGDSSRRMADPNMSA